MIRVSNNDLLFSCDGERESWGGRDDLVVPAMQFWFKWLGASPPSPDCFDLIKLHVRAISWVESRHGTGTGSQPARDPTQVGNPADMAWKTIGRDDDYSKHMIRAGTLPGMAWNDVPHSASELLATFVSNPPILVDPTVLPADGHDDAGFTPAMSYFWCVCWFLYSIQTATGLGAWKLGMCDSKKIFDGAVQYNGGGNPEYGLLLQQTLNCLPRA